MTANDNFQFIPPLYMQRYSKVLDIFSHYKPQKVIDFGCAECRLIRFLKNEEYIEDLCGVDIDRDLLENSKRKIEPLTTDYINPRTHPLTIRLVHASVLVKIEAFKRFDAVTCIELIEHLFPSQLPAFEENIFGFIKPKLVIISTPNSDFNVIFSGNSNEISKLRHWDHKFEWSRKEFSTWCYKICKTYSYSVEFDGVGNPPNGHNSVGFCSQFAVFKQFENESLIFSTGNTKFFRDLVAVSIHPYRSAEDKEETQLFVAFCSCLDALSSAILSMLESINFTKDDRTFTNHIQKAFAALNLNARISSSNRSHFVTNQVVVEDGNQFADVEEDTLSYTDVNRNVYGHEHHKVVVRCFDHAYVYLQRLQDLSCHSKNGFYDFGQYDDSETDFSRRDFMTRPLSAKSSHKDEIINLSDYGSSFHVPVRITDIILADDKDFRSHIIVYRKSDFIKIPLQFIAEMEEIKAHKGNLSGLRSLVQKKGPDGVEMSADDRSIIIEMQSMNTFGRYQRSLSCTSDSITDDENNNGGCMRTYTDEDFFEETWDYD